MALPSGLARQFGFKKEATFGTPVTVDKFVPWVEGNGVENTVDRLTSGGAIPGRTITDIDQTKAGNVTLEGEVGIEAFEQSIGPLLYYALGSVNTSGAGPYTHTLTPGDLTTIGFTSQFGRPGSAGTVHPFTYAGCKMRGIEIAFAQGEIITVGLDILGSVLETTATALASATYAAQATRPFTAIEVTASTVGGAATNVKSASLSIQNALTTDERRFLGQNTIAEPLQNGRREITGELVLEFENLTAYNRYVNMTYGDIVLTASNGTESLSITAYARFGGSTPTVNGDDVLELTQPFTVEGDATDADALTIVYVSDDATINT